MSALNVLRLTGCLVLAVLFSARVQAQLLSEDFEDGVLDSRISITTVGTFSSAPGIKSFSAMDGQNAFGFGLSTNRFNSFGNYATSLSINFAQPTLVGTLFFREMEVFNNWGSGGYVVVDGVIVDTNSSFGRLPYNDGIADTTFRTFSLQLNKSVSQIVLTVNDITDLSEIYVDKISISAVPELSTASLYGLGMLMLLLYTSQARSRVFRR